MSTARLASRAYVGARSESIFRNRTTASCPARSGRPSSRPIRRAELSGSTRNQTTGWPSRASAIARVIGAPAPRLRTPGAARSSIVISRSSARKYGSPSVSKISRMVRPSRCSRTRSTSRCGRPSRSARSGPTVDLPEPDNPIRAIAFMAAARSWGDRGPNGFPRQEPSASPLAGPGEHTDEERPCAHAPLGQGSSPTARSRSGWSTTVR